MLTTLGLRGPARILAVAAAMALLAGLLVAAAGASPRAAGATYAPAKVTSSAKFEKRVLVLVNKVRAEGATCGNTKFGPRKPFKRSPKLAKASRRFAKQMGTQKFFNHTDPQGVTMVDRANAVQYKWRGLGENIAAGQKTPKAVVRGWLASPGHCLNLMGGYRHLGVGHAKVDGSPYGIYWVQMFGTPA